MFAVVEFFNQSVVLRDCFGFLIGLEEKFRQIAFNGVPARGIRGCP
jgi:hypothetical protein